MKKKSKRVEFTESEIKQIDIAANLKGQSTKRFIELAAIAATIQSIKYKVWKSK